MTGSGESGRRRFRENLSNDAVPGGGYVPIDVSTAGAGPRNDFHHPDHGVWKGEYRLSGSLSGYPDEHETVPLRIAASYTKPGGR